MDSYNICVPENEIEKFRSTIDEIYDSGAFSLLCTPVSYKLKSTLEYQISFYIICSEETLREVIEFSGINNIVAICTYLNIYKGIRYYCESGVGRTLIQNTASNHYDLYALSLNYPRKPSYINPFTYTILYDNICYISRNAYRQLR